MNKKHYYLLLLFLFLVQIITAQNFDWAKTGFRPDCSNGVYPRDVTSSPNGSVTSTGYFYAPSTTVNFDGQTLTQLGTSFASDVFIANYNSAGVVQWLRRIGTTLSDGTYPRIDTDANDNIYVATDIAGSTTGVTGDVAGVTLSTVYPNDAVITKLNSAGNPQWVQHITDQNGSVDIRDIDVDNAGNSYVTGSFEGSITVDGTTQTSDGTNTFLAKFDTDGNLLWWENSTGANNDIGYRVHLNGNDVFVLGEMAQGNAHTTMTVDGVTNTIPSGEDRAHFLLKFDTDGNLSWFRYGYLENSGFGSGIFPFYCDIAVDDQDNVYTIHNVTPESQVSAECIYGGSSITYSTVANTSGSGQSNYIITKYSSAGDVQWARGDGTTTQGSVLPTQMILHSDGNLIVSYLISETTVIDGESFTSPGNNDVVIAQFDLEAELVCYKQYGGTNQHWVMALDENPDGSVAYAGHVFGGTTQAIIANYDGIELEGCRNTGVTASFSPIGVNAEFSFVTYPSGEVCQPNNDGLILSASPSGFSKTFFATPNGLSIDASSGTIDVNASSPGTYTVSHVLTDGTPCGTDTVSKTFTINESPTSNAGTDFSLCGTSASLNGNTPSTGDGTWSQISGPSGISITDPTSPSSGITGLSEGSFTFQWEVTNSCGSATDEVVVTVNDIPVVNAGADQEVCEGDEVTLTATTSSGNVSWDNGVIDNTPFTPSSTQTYTVTADNNGCEATDEVVVTVNANPVVNAGADQEICEGEEVTLVATASTGAISWDNGVINNTPFTPLVTQTYTATANNNGCEATDEVVVTVNELPVVDAGDDRTVCDYHDPITLSGSPAGGTFSGTGVSGNEFNPGIGIGTYVITYSYTDANGCEASDELTITVDGCASLDENDMMNSIVIKPNPATDYFDIVGENVESVELITADGRQLSILTNKMSKDLLRIDTTKLSKGTYIIRINTASYVTTRKVVIQ